jgi:hypothetical protein
MSLLLTEGTSICTTSTYKTVTMWGLNSHSGSFEDIFWDITLCSLLRADRRFLGPALMLVSSSAYFLTLKMEAICSSDMSVDSQQTTWHYIPEDDTLQVSHFFICSLYGSTYNNVKCNLYPGQIFVSLNLNVFPALDTVKLIILWWRSWFAILESHRFSLLPNWLRLCFTRIQYNNHHLLREQPI